MQEEWKDINGFEGYYKVSNKGNVISIDRYVKNRVDGSERFIKGRVMKQTKTKGRSNSDTKYLIVNLRKDGYNKIFLVHRLVAESFIDNPNNLPTINHKDGNKENNCVENLEWCSYSDNNKHALDTMLRRPRGKSILQYTKDGRFLNEYKSASEASRITGLDRGSICHCLTKRRDNYAGFIWKYKQ